LDLSWFGNFEICSDVASGRSEMNIFNYIVANKGDHGYRPRPASRSTSSPPGTAGKVKDLADRLEAGEDMWHPRDATDFRDLLSHIHCPISRRPSRLNLIRRISNGKKR